MASGSCAARVNTMANLCCIAFVNVNMVSDRTRVALKCGFTYKDVAVKFDKSGYAMSIREGNLNITGMTRAACSAMIEKVLSRLEADKEGEFQWCIRKRLHRT